MALSLDRVISRLDEYLHKNDYTGAERHLLYWLSEAQSIRDEKAELAIRNELMGLYRKLGKREQAVECAKSAMQKIEDMGISHQVGAATSFLNCATVYKAFGRAEEAIPVFERAREVYEKELEAHDSRLAGLYNNMGLAFVDLKKFDEAEELYKKAVSIMENSENGGLEAAITYLNIASALEVKLGLVDADEQIQALLDKAQTLIEDFPKKDGYYAFVCEKCASVFDYYGRFVFANELKERAERIYKQ